MIESWKPVVGAAFYQVSDQGRVRSLDRVIRGKNGLLYPHAGKVLTGSIGSHGYPMVTIAYDDGSRRNRTVHTLVAETFIGPRPDGCEVLHGDGVRDNCAVSNLRYGTPRENQADSVLHGTASRAEWDLCHRGHPLVAGNLYVTQIKGRGERRQCRECANLTSKEASRIRRGYYDRHPEAAHYV